MTNWNEAVLAEFRANDGTTERFGRRLVVMHTTGAASGEPRPVPVMGLRDGDDWLVTATAAGAPKDPAWAHNLRTHPDIELEVAAPGSGIETHAVHTTEAAEPERSALWQRFLDAAPGFGAYQEKTDRAFPVFRFTKR
jgi:deazaflavin-dependent oxidoreductase (nitroreductase family)